MEAGVSNSLEGGWLLKQCGLDPKPYRISRAGTGKRHFPALHGSWGVAEAAALVFIIPFQILLTQNLILKSSPPGSEINFQQG